MIDRNDLQWYRDAIIYQLHVNPISMPTMTASAISLASRKSSITSRISRDAVWVMPFYPSPLRDDGYDISYYRGINPAYAACGFQTFLREAHERGLRVITSS